MRSRPDKDPWTESARKGKKLKRYRLQGVLAVTNGFTAQLKNMDLHARGSKVSCGSYPICRVL